MERLKKQVEDTASHLYEYYQTQTELNKLQLVEKVAVGVSASAATFSIVFIFFFVLVFASVATAFAIGEWTGRNSIGFFAITGFYLLLGILLLIFKESIKRPLTNNIIKNILSHEEED